MKKFLLSLSLLLAAASASADTYKVVGLNGDWNTDNAPAFTGTDITALTCTIENLSSSFKIVDVDKIVDNEWEAQWGLANDGDVISIGKKTQLTENDGDFKPADINLPSQVSSISNAVLTLNAETFELTLTGTPSYTHAPEQGWVIVGNYTDKPGEEAGQNVWETENAVSLTGSATEVSGIVMNLPDYFKIINADEIDANGEWGPEWGYNDAISVGQTVTLSDSGEAITFADNVSAVKFAKVTFNPTTKALTVEAGYYPTLYVCGLTGWKDMPGTGSNATQMDFDNENIIYSASFSWSAEDNTPVFKLFSENWANEIGGDGSVTIGNQKASLVSLYTSDLAPSDLNIDSSVLGGTTHTLYFNPVTMMMAFDDADLVKTGIPDYSPNSSIGAETKYIYGPAYDYDSTPAFSFSGSTSPIASIVQTEGPAATAEGDDTKSDLDVILFSNFTTGATASIDNINMDVTGANQTLIAVYSDTPGTIEVYGVWKYDDWQAQPTTNLYTIEFTESNIGEWTSWTPTPAELGYGLKDTQNGVTSGEITTINQLVFKGVTVPQFAVAAIAFPSSEPLAVEAVENGKAQTVDVYNLQGICVKANTNLNTALDGMPKGIYIINGKKFVK